VTASADQAIVESPGRAAGRWRSWLAIAGLVAVVVAVDAAVGLTPPFKASGSKKSGVLDNAAAVSLVPVTRRDLSAQTTVSATLGYAGSYDVVNQARGAITALPAIGQVVRQGHSLYSVDGAPVVLLYGSTPAWRDLAEGAKPSDVTGPDVQQLNADLVALGYATRWQLNPGSSQFGDATQAAVKKLQAHLGVPQTGSLSLGQAVFVPTAARITSVSGTLGGPAQPGQSLLKATSSDHQVTINLDAARQGQLKVGDHVTVTLPNQKTIPGVVSSVGTVASTPPGGGDNKPTIPVTVTPTDQAAAGSLDQAPVQVSITTASVKDALVVPVTALLAQAGGGYAVEVVDAAGLHHLVPVTLGLFDDAQGLVQVTGPGLSVGQNVVVPAT
jgi:hypothetical protein